MSHVLVDNITNREGGAIGISSGAVVTGVVTATSFVGDGSGLSGIDATALKDSGGSVKVQGNTSGIIVTGISTFSSNVSIGGTLIYDDVTNIDSVGVVTARAGIKIGAGQSVSAVSGIVTYYGDGSKLSGVESGVVNFVASGTIANGATVIITTDGKVKAVSGVTQSVGSPVNFDTTSTTDISAAYDSTNGKVVVIYKDSTNNSYGTAIVGTVSGTSISFGNEVVFLSNTMEHQAITFAGSGKVVIACNDYQFNTHSRGVSYVGTVSGTSISFGSPVQFNGSSEIQWTGIAYDSTNSRVVITYKDVGNSGRGTAIVGTVSGTSISFGGEVEFETGDTRYTSATFDSNSGKIVIAFRDQGDSYHGKAIVGTVSGTSISFGSATTFASAATEECSATFDSTNNKVVIAFLDGGNSDAGTAVVGTVSGTSISFGDEVVFNDTMTNRISATFDSANGKVVIAYRDSQNSGKGAVIVGTVSGTSISFDSENIFSTSSTSDLGTAYDSVNKKVVIAYQDLDNSNYGKSVVFQNSSTNLTAENYIGIAAEAISNGATGKINVLTGTNTGQTGLITAKTYYVQNNGTLATSAGNPSVVAGTAISDTKIVVR